MMLPPNELAAMRETYQQHPGVFQWENALLAHIDALTEALAAERALADELASVLTAAQAHLQLTGAILGRHEWTEGMVDEVSAVLARYRAARTS